LAEGQAQQIGRAVDDFTLSRVGGGPESLSQYLNGKRGAVVIFWSGICSHCARYDAYFNAFMALHPELGFVAVASRQNESGEMIAATIAGRGLTFPLLHDPGGVVAAKWAAQNTPRAFLIGADRTLHYRGAIDNFRFPAEPEYLTYLEPAIRQFLAGEPVARAETASFGCDVRSVYYILPKAL
jgi:peroxiredoxin